MRSMPAAQKVGLPPTIQTGFSGTAQAYQDSLGSEPLLIAAALAAVYIVLGILYESYIHPITILSTLPSAGVGALLALLLTGTDLSIIAIIGIILLIGIVKKNAIMMIDFALAAERNEGKNSRDSIFEACMLRFRPILMTTMAAMLGALPLALGRGVGSELRRPLGITIIGGLMVSQALTLYTTPVVYSISTGCNIGGIASGTASRKHSSRWAPKDGAGTKEMFAVAVLCEQSGSVTLGVSGKVCKDALPAIDRYIAAEAETQTGCSRPQRSDFARPGSRRDSFGRNFRMGPN